MPEQPAWAGALQEAIETCRAEQWRQGLEQLNRLARQYEPSASLPGVFYSYLGLAIARVEGRKQEGLQLCKHALETQANKADNHINLATLYLLVGRRHAAFLVVDRASRWFPDSARVLALVDRLGVRQPPVFGFLSRGNPLNVMLGQARHWLRVQSTQAKARYEEQSDLRRRLPQSVTIQLPIGCNRPRPCYTAGVPMVSEEQVRQRVKQALDESSRAGAARRQSQHQPLRAAPLRSGPITAAIS
jgi:hypothetical protein